MNIPGSLFLTAARSRVTLPLFASSLQVRDVASPARNSDASLPAYVDNVVIVVQPM